jgi:hypothetical protein
MLTVVILSAVTQIVIMASVVILNVVVPAGLTLPSLLGPNVIKLFMVIIY